jgi:hypothetical protein
VYGRTRAEAHERLVEEQAKARRGIPSRPGLGKHTLKRLSVPTVQTFLNAKLRAGQSVRNVQILSAALSRAGPEKLVPRNVVRLVELPTWEPGAIVP